MLIGQRHRFSKQVVTQNSSIVPGNVSLKWNSHHTHDLVKSYYAYIDYKWCFDLHAFYWTLLRQKLDFWFIEWSCNIALPCHVWNFYHKLLEKCKHKIISLLFILLFRTYQDCVSALEYFVDLTVALILPPLLLSTRSREGIFVTQAMTMTVHVLHTNRLYFWRV